MPANARLFLATHDLEGCAGLGGVVRLRFLVTFQAHEISVPSRAAHTARARGTRAEQRAHGHVIC
jgi:hypothetical protein